MAQPSKSSAHTPGPWFIDRQSRYSTMCIKPYPGRVVCDIDGADGESEANARLIAACPDMKIALEAIRNDCRDWLDEDADLDMPASDLLAAIGHAAEAALAKAENDT